MKLRQMLSAATLKLSERGVESPSRDARILIAHALSVRLDQVTFKCNEEIEEREKRVFWNFVAKRANGMPVSRIIGKRLFWGRYFQVTKDVLDPRGDTELLISLTLNENFSSFLDLGTGSGNLGVTISAERLDAFGVASDISSRALGVAKENAKLHGVSDRLKFKQSNWFEKLEGKFDIIVSNPPYIAESELPFLQREVKAYDPKIALCLGEDPLVAYRNIAREAKFFLETGAAILVEIGFAQGEAVEQIFFKNGYNSISVHKDFGGNDRVVRARMGS